MKGKKFTAYFITNNHEQTEEKIAEARKFMSDKFILCRGESKYIIWCQEIGSKSGRHHEHLYVRFKNPRSYNAIQKMFNVCNVDKARGNDLQCREYLIKGGIFWENGTVSCQGSRTDLKGIGDQILAGRSVDNILKEEPHIYHIYGRTLERLQTLYNRNVYRSDYTKGRWYYGSTGTGKSEKAFAGYNPETHYVKVLEKGDRIWWDGYCGQDIVLFDEFRGEYEMSFILRLTDKTPLSVSNRGKEQIPFISKELIITSCYHPHHIYKDETKKQMQQLYRRFDITKMNWWHGKSSLYVENINKENRLMNFIE